MREWWQGLTARERGLLLVGGVALVAITLTLTVFEPLGNAQQRRHAQITAERGVLSELETLAAEARQLRGNRTLSRAPSAEQSLLAVLNTTAASNQLADRIKRVVPNGDTEASIAFDQIGFDRLLRWLITLREQHGIEIVRIVIDEAGAPGQVNANMTLTTTL